jgi:hypothetical protein
MTYTYSEARAAAEAYAWARHDADQTLTCAKNGLRGDGSGYDFSLAYADAWNAWNANTRSSVSPPGRAWENWQASHGTTIDATRIVIMSVVLTVASGKTNDEIADSVRRELVSPTTGVLWTVNDVSVVT